MTSNTAGSEWPILVIGGAGFIGSHVVEALLAQGRRVRVLDDLSTGRPQNLPMEDSRLELTVGDILDYHVVHDAMQGVERCIHLAGQVAPERSLEDPYGSALWNVLGFINVLQAAHDQRVARLVYGSSCAVYGRNGAEPLAESATPRPMNPYGLEKLVNEQYADMYQRLYGLRCLGLRYFHVYGPRQNPDSPYSGVLSHCAQRLKSGRPVQLPGDGLLTRDFLHVEDAAAATIAALESDFTGVCNVGSGERTVLLQVAELMGERLGVVPEMEFAPEGPYEVRHRVADTRTQRRYLRQLPQRSLEEGLSDFVPETAVSRAETALRALGVMPPAARSRRRTAGDTVRI